MQYDKAVLIALACAGLSGCMHPDAVLFVTDTSVGINVTGKPPSASVAYDRTEGYFGPQYPNGAIPPVVSSLQVGGTIFDPKIRQVYATGAAAVIAAGTPDAPGGPTELQGDPDSRRLAFIGTNTTLGFKVGFDGTTATPDTFLFGYKRREISFIPLGSRMVNGVPTDVYPSALASIDSHTQTAALAGTGLDSTQFFATGAAADTLAHNRAITSAFQTVAMATAEAAGNDRQAAIAMSSGLEAATAANITKVSSAVRNDANFPTDRDTVIANASPALDAPTAAFLKALSSRDALLTALRSDPIAAASIAAGIP